MEGKAAEYFTYTDCAAAENPCSPSQDPYGGLCVPGPRTYTSPAPDDCPCTIPSQRQTVAACAPFTDVQDVETNCA